MWTFRKSCDFSGFLTCAFSFGKMQGAVKRKFSSKFRLPKQFVDTYREKKVNFGFNGLGEIAYIRTYSRKMENGENEQWADTVERIVNGVFTMQSKFAGDKIDPDVSSVLAMRMYDKIFSFKFVPPGRGIWAMGSKITEDKNLYTALNNCAFVSTKPRGDIDSTHPFTFLMD